MYILSVSYLPPRPRKILLASTDFHRNEAPHKGRTRGVNKEASAMMMDDNNNKLALVTKTLTHLLTLPSNRSCADCRCALVDPSKIQVSCCVWNLYSSRQQQQQDVGMISIHDFQGNHRRFAPSSAVRPQRRKTSIKKDVAQQDPAVHVNQKLGGHGVFLCEACAQAHRQLGTSIASVLPLQPDEAPESQDDTANSHGKIEWSTELAQFLQYCGTNASSWRIYERHMPETWQRRRPTPASDAAERACFARAKYEALAFCLPPPGPVAQAAWERILKRNPKYSYYLDESLRNIHALALAHEGSSADGLPSSLTGTSNGPTKSGGGQPPNRLVDFFCIVQSSMRLHPEDCKRSLDTLESVVDLRFWPVVSDSYPDKAAHSDMEFPEHLASFVLPEGCRASLKQLPPFYYSCVLTTGDGDRLYLGVLQIYDEATELSALPEMIRSSGYEGDLPVFLNSLRSHAGVVFFPKCLVVVSHYPFHSLFRDVMLGLYRISLLEAPLPIERYIMNFVSEVPLPPAGHVRVEFGFSTDQVFRMERPPPNQLPIADFSFRPLFACLSVGNILTVLGSLMQEHKVVILSTHYNLLCPIAEAFMAALFPFQWQGLYIPVLPFHMIDILDAPVPFFVGLHGRYLSMNDVARRPKDVVFVDLDRDVVHLGHDEQDGNYRRTPCLPRNEAMKLKTTLDSAGGSCYLLPSSGIKGCILTGPDLLLLNEEREQYAQMVHVQVDADSAGRSEVFEATSVAFSEKSLLLGADLSMEGAFVHDTAEVDSKLKSPKSKNKKNIKKSFQRLSANMLRKKATASDFDEARSQGHLLERLDPEGFSSSDVRNAFLRFFVAIFNGYQRFLSSGSDSDLFGTEDFVGDQKRPKRILDFIHTFLKTQMFQRFLEERRENPDQPELKFFDESIVAKNNRSKRIQLQNGGKKLPTPFLDDTSHKVVKTFTAPRPTGEGLTDRKDSYHYGKFPTLVEANFGRPRPPVNWARHFARQSFRDRKSVSVKVISTNMQIVRKALNPVLTAQTAIVTVARRSAKDLESALMALSPLNLGNPLVSVTGTPVMKRKKGVQYQKMPGLLASSSQGQKSDESTSIKAKLNKAAALMLSARRKQGILLQLIVVLQSYARMRYARRNYNRLRKSVSSLQRRLRVMPSFSQESVDSRAQNRAAKKIQSLYRESRARRHRATRKIQAIYRMFFARRDRLVKIKAAQNLQALWRGFKARQAYGRALQGFTLLQAIYRGRRAHFLFHELRCLIIHAQALFRGHEIRKKVRAEKSSRMKLYRQHIFRLWHHAHESIAVRAKLWPSIFSIDSFLAVAVAEGEVQRLWKLASVEPSKTAKSSTSTLLRSNVYTGCMEFHTKLIAFKLDPAGGPLFKPDRMRVALEQAERIQVYERLADMESAQLEPWFKRFSIPDTEHLRKDRLAREVWCTETQGKLSYDLTVSLFPELTHSPSIKFQKPSAKGARRFPAATKWKDCTFVIDQATLDSMTVEGRRKANVRATAVEVLSKSPKQHHSKSIYLSKKEERKAQLLLRTKAFAPDLPAWRQVRRDLIVDAFADKPVPPITSNGASQDHPPIIPTVFPDIDLHNGKSLDEKQAIVDKVVFPDIDLVTAEQPQPQVQFPDIEGL